MCRRPVSSFFIEESGRSAADPPGTGFSALAGVALQEEHVAAYQRSADDLKREFFGTTALTFHEPMMRNHDGPYYFHGDRDRQAEFDAALNHLVEQTLFVAFGVGVRRRAMR